MYIHTDICSYIRSQATMHHTYVILPVSAHHRMCVYPVLLSGNWLNKFMADFQVTNPSNERLAVTDITGHYMDEGVPLIETCCRAEGISTFQSGIHTTVVVC